MPMLSELLRYSVVDDQGRRTRLADLSYHANGDDYPKITRLFFVEDGEHSAPWASVRSVDEQRREIKIADLALPEGNEPNGRVEVRLAAEVLDGLVINLLHRSTSRATDVLLNEDGRDLTINSVDSGFSAMLRRISGGWYTRVNPGTLIDWKYVEFLRGDPDAAENGAGYRLRIGRLPAGEIAELSEYIPYLHAAELLTLLDDDKAADVLEAMPVDQQVQVIEEFDDDEAIELVRRMSPDLAADLLARLDVPLMYKYLQKMPKTASARIIELLRYPEHSVGGVMINDMISLPADKTIGEVRELLPALLDSRDFVSTIFVVNDETNGILRGVVSLREVLMADAGKTLEELMFRFLQTLDPFESARAGAFRIVATQLSAMPVVDPDGRLVGAMTVDAAMSQLLSGQLRGMRIYT